ncbi:MAG: response regulator [Anaerolineae bacterium]|nr:response regulator [Candidatus Roseilinea sp.]MDW8449168.1 response regulator [Anaerolineae bacterium]
MGTHPASDDAVIWTRKALANLFDLDFLARHIGARTQFTHALQAQQRLLRAIESIRPPASMSIHSPAWRRYNVLNLIYVQGLSQAEVAAQLNLGVRQLRRELAKGVRAIAALLFTEEVSQPPVSPAPERAPAQAKDYLRCEELLRRSLALLEPLLERQDLTVNVAISDGLPTLYGDPMVIRQLIISALTWLLSDVRGAVLHITLGAEGDELVLRLERPSSASAVERLNAVRSLADMAGVRVELQQADAQLRLTLRLDASSKRCVLMIDDNPDAIQLVRRYLDGSAEFDLVSATSADEALRVVAALQPACILLDVMLPQRDGWELLTLFRAHPETARIPIVISSVLRQDELARALGATAILPKPFTAEELLATLRATSLPARLLVRQG